MEPLIEIVIGPHGETEIAVSGCAGPTCTDLTKAIEQALGTVTGDRKTPEFYLRQEVRREQR